MKKLVHYFMKRLLYIYQMYEYDLLKKKYSIHPSFRFNGNNIQFYGDGAIVIGENSYIGEYSTLQAASGCTIKIGKGCAISHNVRVYTSTAIAHQDFSKEVRSKTGNVTIGNFVWIGVNVYINPGVEIGDNAIVGANSVIVKNVPANAIVSGIPASLVSYKNYDAASRQQ
jgi:maltose O-acetyltransferase